MTGKTRPEGYPVTRNLEDKSRYRASAPFVASLSVILGAIISIGVILGVAGRAFYVTRSEYTDKNLKDIETVTTFQQTLNQLKETMSQQAASFKEMTAGMEAIRIEMAGRRR
jgi:hypothetical protein